MINWNKIYPNLVINSIYNGATHTIFGTDSGEYYVSGWNDDGQCGIGDDEEYIKECRHITYFNDHNIKITKICTTPCNNYNTCTCF